MTKEKKGYRDIDVIQMRQYKKVKEKKDKKKYASRTKRLPKNFLISIENNVERGNRDEMKII